MRLAIISDTHMQGDGRRRLPDRCAELIATSDGRLERMRRRFPGADAVVFGHSHIPLHVQEGDFQISGGCPG